MKILYSCLSNSWGGMEMFTLTAVKQLLKKNISVELLCIADSRIHMEAHNLGFILHPIKASGYVHPASTLKIAALIRKNKYDLIHTQASKDLWLLVPALKVLRSKIPLLLTKQVGSFIIKKDRLHRWLYNRLTFALAISQVIKRNLLETCPLKEEKVLMLHNGIDIEKFNHDIIDRKPVREEFEINNDTLLIGMLARFSPGKGHEEFLIAANELNKKYDNLKFMIVGEASRGEDKYASEIKLLAKEYKLNNVVFTGFRSDTANILAAMDVFVFPSHSEAFGIALAEAMAMGKASVCSNSDGILDIAVDGETSFLFQKQDGIDLAKKIELLILSPDKIKTFGNAARKRAVENFNLELLTQKVIEIYENSLLKNKK